MTRKTTHFPTHTAISLVAILSVTGCNPPSDTTHNHTETEHAESTEDLKGSHGGRLLQNGDFAVEVTIFETGIDPQFRLYPYLEGELISPDSVELVIQLERLGGLIDTFTFEPKEDYLVGNGIVTEPHSFVVTVTAKHKGQTHSWAYDSLEGRTTFADTIANAAGIKTAIAGPGQIALSMPVTGAIDFAPGAVAEVRSPYTSRVVRLSKSVGDPVSRGDLLATLENVSTLQPLSIRAPHDGVVIERTTNVGDVTGGTPLFKIGDTSRLEAQLNIFPKDQIKVQPGLTVSLPSPRDKAAIETEITSYLPLAQANSQTLTARAPIPENSGFYPGLRVSGDITIETIDAPLAVRTSGLQRFRDFTVVFAKVDETYEVRMLELGKRDRDWVEVLGGLAPGTEYVTANAFLLKADVEKSGASHDH